MTEVAGRVQDRLVWALDDPRARDAAVVGSKAANLATAHHAGLPVLPGFAVTTEAHAGFLDEGRLPLAAAHAILQGWSRLTEGGAVPVIVRSSSTVEDAESSSMAGRFRSVPDVRSRDGLVDAVTEVLRSADVAAGTGVDGGPGAMGVLVQRHLSPARAGVMFGVDPVTGDPGRIVIEAVAGGPDKLVSGRVTAQHYVTTRSGRLVSLDHRPAHALLRRHHDRRLLGTTDLFELASLARRTRRVFGSPQDVEWAFDAEGTLVLLQSRPVTATAPTAPVHGPVLGPGPLGETFPDPLSELEVDLWLRPLRDGVVQALAETRAVTPRRLSSSPVVTTVVGRIAADLELFGYVRHRSALGPLDPRPAFRQLRAAWRTGLVRAELPSRCDELVAEADAALSVADLSGVDDSGLVALARGGVSLLRRLHQAEVLAGTLLEPGGGTAAALALHVLHALGPDRHDPGVVRRHPVLLALVPPTLAGDLVLPRTPTAPPAGAPQPLGRREALRLRIRWAQELTARTCRVLEHRLLRSGSVPEPGIVALLRLDELDELVRSGRLPADLHERRARELGAVLAAPLPAEFRLADDGRVVPVARAGARSGGGVPAGGGRSVGRVAHGSVRRPPSPGDVLVVRELQPGLAAYLPGLAGLVAETGSTLSHLAILAREYEVPTVVAVHDAVRRFPEGSRLFVDGATGEVRTLEGGEQQ